jgi:16S rRNA (uracil1498-N3)-methyltransferase
MTRRRWIADEVSGSRAVLTGEHAEHLARVLRARVGEEFDIATGSAVRRGRIARIENHRVEFELGEEVAVAPAPDVTLVLAIYKFDRMEWALEKCSELGVRRVVPVVASRTEKHLARAAGKRVARWRKIVLQAAEQSRRSAPPEVADPAKLRDAIALCGSVRILLSESEQQRSLKQVLELQSAAREILLAIGPEGGWTAAEQQLFTQSGWISASLGATILRAETAAIAALAVVMAELA